MVMGYTVALGGALLDNATSSNKFATSPSAIRSPAWRTTGICSMSWKMNRAHHRSGRPFSVLLLDLDDLKKINDNYGHLVGSRAICRLADVLRIHCRAIDTAARYGGDEFALSCRKLKRMKRGASPAHSRSAG